MLAALPTSDFLIRASQVLLLLAVTGLVVGGIEWAAYRDAVTLARSGHPVVVTDGAITPRLYDDGCLSDIDVALPTGERVRLQHVSKQCPTEDGPVPSGHPGDLAPFGYGSELEVVVLERPRGTLAMASKDIDYYRTIHDHVFLFAASGGLLGVLALILGGHVVAAARRPRRPAAPEGVGVSPRGG